MSVLVTMVAAGVVLGAIAVVVVSVALAARGGGAGPVGAAAVVAPSAAPSGASPVVPTGAALLAGVTSWTVRLHGLTPAEIAALPEDLVVVDHSADGTAAGIHTAGDVAAMRTRTGPVAAGTRRLVLAYVAVATAEDDRFYFDPDWREAPPPWLLPENRSVPGTFPARWWEPGWQRLLFGTPESYVDRLIAAGFDGVHLDLGGAIDDLVVTHPRIAAGRADLEHDTIDLIVRLSRYAKGRVPRFAVTVEDADDLLGAEALLQAVDAVVKRGLLYGGAGPDRPSHHDDVRAARRGLDRARHAGRAVLVLEAVQDPARAAAARATLADYGYVPAVAAGMSRAW
jgi:cysteinyl-tRNA synthetase